MGIIAFCKYNFLLVNAFIDISNSNDLVLSLGLYVIYPAILYLLIDKFHGVCGPETYLKKIEAIDACNTIFLLFTTLLRTSKLIYVIIFTVDADYKDGSSKRNLNILDSDDDDDDDVAPRPPPRGGTVLGGLMSKLQCQTWVHLSHELAIVGFVSFLLIVCLPVLAFWTMLISICFSMYTLYSQMKRLWKDAHDPSNTAGGDADGEGDGGGDLEFQEFLSNFSGND